MVILLTGKLSQGGYIISSVGFKWVPYNKDFTLYYRGMEVLGWWKFVPSLYGNCLWRDVFQFSPLRNIIQLFSNCLQIFLKKDKIQNFQALGPNSVWLKANYSKLLGSYIFISAIVAGISKSNWDMLEGMV